MLTARSSTARSVGRLLHDDHAHLEALFEEVVEAAGAGVDHYTLGEIWRRFEEGVRQHLAAEETWLFPHLESRHPTAVAALRAEHDWIRRQLDVVGLDVDLHLVRSHHVTELVERLRAHAAEEDATAYLWAENESSGDRRDMVDRLMTALSSLRGDTHEPPPRAPRVDAPTSGRR